MTARPTTLRVAPTDLDGHPAVERLLVRLGLGPFTGTDIGARPGANENWTGTTTSGRRVFVKRLGRGGADAADRLRRAVSFEDLIATAPGPLHSPACLGTGDGLMVFDLVPDGRTGLELAIADEFDEPLAVQVGRALAHLHALDAPAGVDDRPPPLPPYAWLDGLPWEVYLGASAGTLELWRTIHADPQLVADIRAIGARDAAAPRGPAHCDVRLDQLLHDGDRLHVTDWEDFRLADPARDVGGFAGEWVHRAVLGLAAAGDAPQEAGDPAAAVAAHGVRELDRVRPVVAAFWAAYTAARRPDPQLALRATALAGWHLFDRLLAAGPDSPRLTPTQRAAAGIGRLLMHRPGATAALLGLDGGAR